MQPLTRVVPTRLFFDSIPRHTASRGLQLQHRVEVRSRICLGCRAHQQQRLYANESKPPLPPGVETSDPPPIDTKDASTSPEKDRNTPIQHPISASTSSPQDANPPHPEDIHPSTLPSGADSQRSALNHRLSHLMDNLQSNIFVASQRLNDLTGYTGIESLKKRISTLESRSLAAQDQVRASRTHYKTVVASRATTQRETTTLLARKDSWTPLDLERFTNLYRMDHSNEQAVQEASRDLAEAEREAETLAGKLSASILERYHEEQIWSDKIRRMSTWGTWGLMGVNVLLFLVFQFGFEPWRRRRLVSGFEEKVLEALEREKGVRGVEGKSADDVPAAILANAISAAAATEKSDALTDSPMIDESVAVTQKSDEQISTTEEPPLQQIPLPTELSIQDPKTWKAALEDLFSPRLVQLRKQDVTTIALEGAATGAALTAIIATLILRSSGRR